MKSSLAIRYLKKFLCGVLLLALLMPWAPTPSASAAWNGEFTLSSASYLVGEGSGSVSITIFLTGSYTSPKPTIQYTTSVDPDGTAFEGSDYVPITGVRKFNKAGAWTFRVPILNDIENEGNEIFYIVLSSPQGGPGLGTPSSATVTIVDDDRAGVTVTPASGLSVTEAGSAAIFSVLLNKTPTADVIINLSSSDTTEGTVSPSSLTFTPANWSEPQSVIIIGEDDSVDDGDVVFSIGSYASSSDGLYDGLLGDEVAVTNLDDDTAGITVTPTSGLSVTEDLGTDTFTMVLNSEPMADVGISLTSDDVTEGTVSPALVIFTPLNWYLTQTITVTGVNDFIVDKDVIFHIITGDASGFGSGYDGLSVADVTVINIDNDSAGITVTPTSGLTASEMGGIATFSVVLSESPTDNVTIGISSSDPGEGTVSPGFLSFTVADWDTPQFVTITGVDDYVDDGDQPFSVITTNTSGSESGYYGLPVDDVLVTNLDDDIAGITVAPTSGLIVTEDGGTDTFSVVLNSEPTYDVVIALTSDNTVEGTVSPETLTFTNMNWNYAQVVTITGMDDPIADGDTDFTIVTGLAVSSDDCYNSANASDVSVTNLDNDDYWIRINPGNGLIVTEAGAFTSFNVELVSQPTADVSIDLTSSDPTEGTVSPSSLVFTTENWNSSQTVIISGVEDYVDDGDTGFYILTTAATSTDINYDGIDPIDPAVVNLDDDTAGVLITPTSGLIVTEAGGIATVSVVLTSEPNARVSILVLNSSDLTEALVSPSSLNFTAANWNITQKVIITGVDDGEADDDVAFEIITEPVISADPIYNGMNPSNIAGVNIETDIKLFLPFIFSPNHD